jgi:hypothetical protein
MVMMQPPPGMAELIAKLGLQNPALLAATMAAKGVRPPALPSTTAAMGGSPAGSAAAATPAAPAATNPGPPSGAPGTLPAPINPDIMSPPSVPKPVEPTPTPAPTVGPTDYAGLAAKLGGASGVMTPTAAGGAGQGVRYPPQAPQPGGALASQMPDILKLLMAGGAPQPLPSLGSLILGR